MTFEEHEKIIKKDREYFKNLGFTWGRHPTPLTNQQLEFRQHSEPDHLRITIYPDDHENDWWD